MWLSTLAKLHQNALLLNPLNKAITMCLDLRKSSRARGSPAQIQMVWLVVPAGGQV